MLRTKLHAQDARGDLGSLAPVALVERLDVQALQRELVDRPFQQVGRERSPEAGTIIDRLQAEHRNGPENLRDLREKLVSTAAGGENNTAFTAALRNYTQGLKSHVRSEEKDAMPLAREVLTADDWAEIDRAFLDNEDPLFGAKAKAGCPVSKLLKAEITLDAQLLTA